MPRESLGPRVTNADMAALVGLPRQPTPIREAALERSIRRCVQAGFAAGLSQHLHGEFVYVARLLEPGAQAVAAWLARPAVTLDAGRFGLTAMQRRGLALIRDSLEANGVSPSYDELAGALGLKSKSGVHRLVEQLEARGYVTRLRGRRRSLALATPGARAAA